MERTHLDILVEKVSKGDVEAFAQLCKEVYPGAVYQATAILRNYHDAEEAVQNVLLKVYNKIDTLRETYAFRAWLQKLVVNECLNFKRSNEKRKDDIPYEEETDLRTEDKKDWLPQENMENSEYAEVFSRIIDTLPEQRKRAIILYYYEDLSYKEISEIMGISMSNVSSTITRAKKYLKEEMKKTTDIDIEFDDKEGEEDE